MDLIPQRPVAETSITMKCQLTGDVHWSLQDLLALKLFLVAERAAVDECLDVLSDGTPVQFFEHDNLPATGCGTSQCIRIEIRAEHSARRLGFNFGDDSRALLSEVPYQVVNPLDDTADFAPFHNHLRLIVHTARRVVIEQCLIVVSQHKT